jgi:hypothetical protein
VCGVVHTRRRGLRTLARGARCGGCLRARRRIGGTLRPAGRRPARGGRGRRRGRHGRNSRRRNSRRRRNADCWHRNVGDRHRNADCRHRARNRGQTCFRACGRGKLADAESGAQRTRGDQRYPARGVASHYRTRESSCVNLHPLGADPQAKRSQLSLHYWELSDRLLATSYGRTNSFTPNEFAVGCAKSLP